MKLLTKEFSATLVQQTNFNYELQLYRRNITIYYRGIYTIVNYLAIETRLAICPHGEDA